MITKIGFYLSIAPAVGASTGIVRASNLTSDERKKLIDTYGLPSDASLTARNAGRGALGGLVGALGAGTLGAGITGGIAGYNGVDPEWYGPLGVLAGTVFGIPGAIYGTKKMTDKYSKSALK